MHRERQNFSFGQQAAVISYTVCHLLFNQWSVSPQQTLLIIFFSLDPETDFNEFKLNHKNIPRNGTKLKLKTLIAKLVLNKLAEG